MTCTWALKTFREQTKCFYHFYNHRIISCIRPAEGVQTLSEHDALSRRQGGEADGTVCLCGVIDQVLLLCCQQVQIVPLSFLLLSLHHTETDEGQTQHRDSLQNVMTHYKQHNPPISWKWKVKQLLKANGSWHQLL